MVARTPLHDNKETPIGGPIFDFLRTIDANRRYRLWIGALKLAPNGVTTPGELYGRLLACVALQQARALLFEDRALAGELLDVTEALLTHRVEALAFCAAVLGQVAARAAEPAEWVPS